MKICHFAFIARVIFTYIVYIYARIIVAFT